MRKSRIILSTAMTAALAFAVAAPASAATTAAKPHALGPGWRVVTLKAYYGGGCAMPDNGLVNGSPIVNEPCNGGDVYIWYWRYMGDDKNEFVNYSGTEALSYSDGEFKLMPPNDATTYVLMVPFVPSDEYGSMSNAAGTAYAGESAKGTPLVIYPHVVGEVQGGWQVNSNGIAVAP